MDSSFRTNPVPDIGAESLPTCRTKDKAFRIGDPIASNTGGFYWEKRLLNLGGIIPLIVDVSSYMNDPNFHRCYINLENMLDYWEWQPNNATIDFGAPRESTSYYYSEAYDLWVERTDSKSGRLQSMCETSGYYYL